MDTSISIFEFAGVLVTLAGIITGSAIWYVRKNSDRMETSNEKLAEKLDESNKELTKSIASIHNELRDEVKQNHLEIKNDVKALSFHLDERIDKMQDRMAMSSAELKEFVGRQVSELKAKDNDQDLKLEKTREKMHEVNQKLLEFRIEVSENYEKKAG